MESPRTYLCTLCTDDGISNIAVTWCTECEGFLCTDCEKHHKRSKASKEHSTKSTVDYLKIPKSIRETSNRCKYHDKKLELYCSSHACPCCIQCIGDTHQKCQGMKPLADFLKEVKSSAAISLLQNDLKDLKEIFEEAIKHLKNKIKTINIDRENGIEYVKSMRKLLKDHFDKLERQIIDSLESKHSDLKTETEELVKEMEYRSNRVGQLEGEFSTMAKYATELQLYVGMQEFEKTASKETKYMEGLKSKNYLDNSNLEVKIASDLYSILQDDYSFGNIYIKSTPHSVQSKIGRKDQAQRIVPIVLTNDKVKPSPMNSLRFPAAQLQRAAISNRATVTNVRIFGYSVQQEKNKMIKICQMNQASTISVTTHQELIVTNLKFKKTVMNNPDIYSKIRTFRVSLDKETANREVSVSKDGTTFDNRRPAFTFAFAFNPNRHERYKGARGTHGFTLPGIYFYEVILSLKVVAPLQLNNIVLETGIARMSAIDKKSCIEGQQYAYSMLAVHHPACDATCVRVVRDRKVLFHKTLMKNQIDEECRLVLGFLLNTDAGTWEIYNMEEDVRICVVRDVNFDEPLFPVISGYNPSQVQVTATFGSGH